MTPIEGLFAWFSAHEAELSGMAAFAALIAIALSPLRGTIGRLLGLTATPANDAEKNSLRADRGWFRDDLDERPSIAVPPVREAPGERDPTRGLAEGLHEGVVGDLAKQAAVRVLTDSPEDADFRLEGGIRGVGERVRISFTLNETASHSPIWSERYDRELHDLLDLEDEVATNVAAAVRIRIKARAFEKLRDRDNETLAVGELLSKAAGFFVTSYEHNEAASAALGVALRRQPENSMAVAMSVFCQ